MVYFVSLPLLVDAVLRRWVAAARWVDRGMGIGVARGNVIGSALVVLFPASGWVVPCFRINLWLPLDDEPMFRSVGLVKGALI